MDYEQRLQKHQDRIDYLKELQRNYIASSNSKIRAEIWERDILVRMCVEEKLLSVSKIHKIIRVSKKTVYNIVKNVNTELRKMLAGGK